MLYTVEKKSHLLLQHQISNRIQYREVISSGVGEIRGERWSAVAGGETKGNMKAWHRHRGFPMDLSTAMVERMAERTMNYLRNFLATSIWTAPELVIKVPHDARKDMFFHSYI